MLWLHSCGSLCRGYPLVGKLLKPFSSKRWVRPARDASHVLRVRNAHARFCARGSHAFSAWRKRHFCNLSLHQYLIKQRPQKTTTIGGITLVLPSPVTFLTAFARKFYTNCALYQAWVCRSFSGWSLNISYGKTPRHVPDKRIEFLEATAPNNIRTSTERSSNCCTSTVSLPIW